ncbi:MAG: hypothetical protein Q8K69_15185 [Bacteroidota bacterium]|nr:hypothetical protein [Bacteroidota bacterium]
MYRDGENDATTSTLKRLNINGIKFSPLRGWGLYRVIFPGFHPGLLTLNPFRISKNI